MWDLGRRYWSDLKRKFKQEGFDVYEKIVHIKMPDLLAGRHFPSADLPSPRLKVWGKAPVGIREIPPSGPIGRTFSQRGKLRPATCQLSPLPPQLLHLRLILLRLFDLSKGSVQSGPITISIGVIRIDLNGSGISLERFWVLSQSGI